MNPGAVGKPVPKGDSSLRLDGSVNIIRQANARNKDFSLALVLSGGRGMSVRIRMARMYKISKIAMDYSPG